MAQPQFLQRFPGDRRGPVLNFLEDLPELQPSDPVVDSLPSKEDTFQPTDVY